MRKNFYLIITSLVIVSCLRYSDHSKTLEEYYDNGIPNIESEWQSSDLIETIEVLKKMKQIDSFPLPKFNSKKSSGLYNKIIEEIPKIDVLDSLNVSFQTNQFRQFRNVIIELIFLYGAKAKEQIYYSYEAIQLERLIVDQGTKGVSLAIRYPSISKESDLYKDSYEKMQNGYFTIIEASLRVNQSHHRYSLEDKIILAETTSNSIQFIWELLDIEYQVKIHNQVKEAIKYADNDETRNILNDLDLILQKKRT
ncbi:hypothetical protein D7030_11355 [Flavobacteriaceae bacterium AU392]|nr:hypothetical protein D1817_13315 [Flavobacteriaceae bacterium]RKM82756.1 hypothetical protein D7030_11355 [Flavobacteriaceae bacterium AU392]